MLTQHQFIESFTIVHLQNFLDNYPFRISPTKQKICFPRFRRIACLMSDNIVFPPIKFCDDNIIDGHHRYLAACFLNCISDFQITNCSFSMLVYEWPKIAIDENDWELTIEVKKNWKKLAEFNNMNLAQFLHLYEYLL